MPDENTGKGRHTTTKRYKAKMAGDLERAEALTPASKRKIPDDQKCGALTRNETYCQARKGTGTDHLGYGNCSRHGGNTTAGVKSAMREMGRDLTQRYKSEILRFGGDRRDASIANITPEQALLEEVRRSAAMVRFLEERIARWNLSPVQETLVEAFASTSKRDQSPGLRQDMDRLFNSLDASDPDSPAYLPSLVEISPRTGLSAFTDAREWLLVYREERGHLARTAKMAIDAGVAQRLVSIAEDQGRILASAIRAVLLALNLSPEQNALIPRIVPPILRAVASDSPIPDISSLLGSPSASTIQGELA